MLNKYLMRLSQLFLGFIPFVCSSCEKLEFNEPVTNHVNICVLGNSYSNDSFSYVPFILLEYGVTCHIHVYYRGSGSLRDLYEQWNDAESVGIAETDGGNHVRLHYSIDTRLNTRWVEDSLMSANDILKIDKWDIVTLQQVSKKTSDINSYEPYLGDLIQKIDSICNYKYNRTWFMAYNRAKENQLYENNLACINTQQKIVERYPFDMILPVATSVFNCQQTDSLSVLGDSQYHNMYSSDDVHLQEGLPCYAAALAISEAILRKYKPEVNVLGNTQRPTSSWIRLINSITPNGSSTGVNESNCRLAQEIAIVSNDNKFEIIKVQ